MMVPFDSSSISMHEESDEEERDAIVDLAPAVYTEQIWQRRLSSLVRMKVREGGEYERPEDYALRKQVLESRVTTVQAYKNELRRRYQAPTDLDDVKFALYDIIDTICDNDRAQQEEAVRASGELADARGLLQHMATDGHLLTKLDGRDPFHDFLNFNPNVALRPRMLVRKSNNDRSALVTDMRLEDIIISSSGMMLPVVRRIPPPLTEEQLATASGRRGLDLMPSLEDVNASPDKTGASVVSGPSLDGDGPTKNRYGGSNASSTGDDQDNKGSGGGGGGGAEMDIEEAFRFERDKKKTWKDRALKALQGMNTLIKVLVKQRSGSLLDRFMNKQDEESATDDNTIPDLGDAPVLRLEELTADAKPFNQKFPDAVTITVTVLLDPPPHYIWQIDEEATKALEEVYKVKREKDQARRQIERKERKMKGTKTIADADADAVVASLDNSPDNSPDRSPNGSLLGSPTMSPMRPTLTTGLPGGSASGLLGSIDEEAIPIDFLKRPSSSTLPPLLTLPLPSTLKKWDLLTGKGVAVKTQPVSSVPAKGTVPKLPLAPPLVGTGGRPGHHSILGCQPASGVFITKCVMTADEVAAAQAAAAEEVQAAVTRDEARKKAVADALVHAAAPGPAAAGEEEDVGAVGPSVAVGRARRGGRLEEEEDDDDDDDDDEYDEYDDLEGEGEGHEEEEGEGNEGGAAPAPEGDVGASAPAAGPPEVPWAERRRREIEAKKGLAAGALSNTKKKAPKLKPPLVEALLASGAALPSAGPTGPTGATGASAGRTATKPVPVWKMDRSAMAAFELQWATEVAKACCLPVENVTVDEIRRLPRDDPKLLRLRGEEARLDAARRGGDDATTAVAPTTGTLQVSSAAVAVAAGTDIRLSPISYIDTPAHPYTDLPRWLALQETPQRRSAPRGRRCLTWLTPRRGGTAPASTRGLGRRRWPASPPPRWHRRWTLSPTATRARSACGSSKCVATALCPTQSAWH